MEKVVLITGASGGMGGALANYFQKENMQLALHSNNNPVSLSESDKIAHFKADLTKEDEGSSRRKASGQHVGRSDGVSNNAGISKSSISWKTSTDDWKESLAVNLDAPFYVSKHVAPIMRANKWGRIINITSVVAQTGFIGTAAYAASKAGLIGPMSKVGF